MPSAYDMPPTDDIHLLLLFIVMGGMLLWLFGS
jgi:hypothetical protein